MALLTENCPRCGHHKMTFDARSKCYRETRNEWIASYEVFCVCRSCKKSSTFVLEIRDFSIKDQVNGSKFLEEFTGDLNTLFNCLGYLSLKDSASIVAPLHLLPEVKKAFDEGSTCYAVGCYNAAAIMYRLCVDLVTTPFLPDPADANATQPNSRERRDLGLRLQWLFDNGSLPENLRELAKCIREDANEGAHRGTLTKDDSEDVQDFTIKLLERLVTEPKELELAQKRRDERRDERRNQPRSG